MYNNEPRKQKAVELVITLNIANPENPNSKSDGMVRGKKINLYPYKPNEILLFNVFQGMKILEKMARVVIKYVDEEGCADYEESYYLDEDDIDNLLHGFNRLPTSIGGKIAYAHISYFKKKKA